MHFLKKFLSIKKQSFLAIELTSGYARALEITKNNGHLEILSIAEITARNSREETLAILINETKPSTKKVFCALPYSATLCKTVAVPKTLSISEIEQYCRFSAAKQLGISDTEVNIDFHVDRQNTKTNDRIQVKLFAVPKKIMDEHLNLFNRQKLLIAAIDIDAYALACAIKFHYPKFNDIFLAINFNANKFLFVAMSTNEINFIHEYSCHEKNVLEEVLASIKNYTASNKQTPQKIILSGTIDYLAILKEELHIKLNIETTIFNPLQNIKINSQFQEKTAPMFALCFGLALRI